MNQEKISKIYIIESPSSVDLLENRVEGNALASMLDLMKIPHNYYLAIDDQCFANAIVNITTDIIMNIENGISICPVIHISCHGTKEGIVLTNGIIYHWELLAMALNCVCRSSTNEQITVVLSSCYGFYGMECLNGIEDVSGETITIGCTEEVGWDTALVAFNSFYYNYIVKRVDLDNSVYSMNSSINDAGKFLGVRKRDM